jgi:hypothetical protein
MTTYTVFGLIPPQTSHIIDYFSGSSATVYTDCVPFELVGSAAPPMKSKLRWRGTNSVSTFGHHNINGGAGDNT